MAILLQGGFEEGIELNPAFPVLLMIAWIVAIALIAAWLDRRKRGGAGPKPVLPELDDAFATPDDATLSYQTAATRRADQFRNKQGCALASFEIGCGCIIALILLLLVTADTIYM
jgi:hypothetical protein